MCGIRPPVALTVSNVGATPVIRLWGDGWTQARERTSVHIDWLMVPTGVFTLPPHSWCSLFTPHPRCAVLVTPAYALSPAEYQDADPVLLLDHLARMFVQRYSYAQIRQITGRSAGWVSKWANDPRITPHMERAQRMLDAGELHVVTGPSRGTIPAVHVPPAPKEKPAPKVKPAPVQKQAPAPKAKPEPKAKKPAQAPTPSAKPSNIISLASGLPIEESPEDATEAPVVDEPASIEDLTASALACIQTAIVKHKDVYTAQWLLERLQPELWGKPAERLSMAKLAKLAAEVKEKTTPSRTVVTIEAKVRDVELPPLDIPDPEEP